MKIHQISENIIRRLPRYFRLLTAMQESGQAKTSSFEIAARLGLTSSQVRQDLNTFGSFGQQGYGYDVAVLRASIGEILGMEEGYRGILVGVGQVGLSLLDSFDFAEWGMKLQAAFDVDPAKIGAVHGGVEVLSSDKLEQYLDLHEADFAVLAVNRAHAQECADRLIACGIKAIWNFTNVDIVPPDSPVISENVHFSDSLCALSYYITQRSEGNWTANKVE